MILQEKNYPERDKMTKIHHREIIRYCLRTLGWLLLVFALVYFVILTIAHTFYTLPWSMQALAPVIYCFVGGMGLLIITNPAYEQHEGIL